MDREELVDQVRDPECDHVGPYKKSGDNEVEILTLLAEHGLELNEDGLAVDADHR